MKKYKVINLMLSNEDYSGVETLIAELSETERMEIEGLSFALNFNSGKGEYFVFEPKSQIGQRLLRSPEEDIEIDLNDFSRDILNLAEGDKPAYFHFEYISKRMRK